MDERQFLKVAKALSDPTRLRMHRELSAAGEVSCGELAKRFPITQPTVSHHLKVLEEAGLVVSRREGQCHYYSAVAGALVEFSRNLQAPPGRLPAYPRSARQ